METETIINIGFNSEEVDVIRKEIQDDIRQLRKEQGFSDEIIQVIEEKEGN